MSVARDRLSELISEVAHGKGRIVLESHGRPKAALVCLEDLRRLEPDVEEFSHAETEMMAWLEQTERMLTRPRRADASLGALRDVREEQVADDPAVFGRERRTQARRRRKR